MAEAALGPVTIENPDDHEQQLIIQPNGDGSLTAILTSPNKNEPPKSVPRIPTKDPVEYVKNFDSLFSGLNKEGKAAVFAQLNKSGPEGAFAFGNFIADPKPPANVSATPQPNAPIEINGENGQKIRIDTINDGTRDRTRIQVFDGKHGDEPVSSVAPATIKGQNDLATLRQKFTDIKPEEKQAIFKAVTGDNPTGAMLALVKPNPPAPAEAKPTEAKPTEAKPAGAKPTTWVIKNEGDPEVIDPDHGKIEFSNVNGVTTATYSSDGRKPITTSVPDANNSVIPYMQKSWDKFTKEQRNEMFNVVRGQGGAEKLNVLMTQAAKEQPQAKVENKPMSDEEFTRDALAKADARDKQKLAQHAQQQHSPGHNGAPVGTASHHGAGAAKLHGTAPQNGGGHGGGNPHDNGHDPEGSLSSDELNRVSLDVARTSPEGLATELANRTHDAEFDAKLNMISHRADNDTDFAHRFVGKTTEIAQDRANHPKANIASLKTEHADQVTIRERANGPGAAPDMPIVAESLPSPGGSTSATKASNISAAQSANPAKLKGASLAAPGNNG